MANLNERIAELITKKLDGQISQLEEAELQIWANENPVLYADLTDRRKNAAEALKVLRIKKEVFGKLQAEIPALTAKVRTGPRIIYWQRYAAAGILVFVLMIGYMWIREDKKVKSSNHLVAVDQSKTDIAAPVGNRTRLTLSNGTSIDLDSTKNGSLAMEGKIAVAKLSAGQLNYTELSEKPKEAVYNTVSTQRGGTYQIVLPDGSKVWLNSQSSLRFPTAFAGKERTVVLSGEAYFEITKQPAAPFKIEVEDGSAVQVLGTQFNVNAYSNEPRSITTLIEGSVKLSKGSVSKVLNHGQQASILNSGMIEVKEGDATSAIAWKDGLFKFNSADIETVMRTLARWYDVDVKFSGEKSGNLLTAQVKRSHNASDVLKVLEISGYHFKIDDRTIVVMP